MLDLHRIIITIIISAISGITEFLPISSTGHTIIIYHILNIQKEEKMLNAFVQLGSVLSIIIFFIKKYINKKELYTLMKNKKKYLINILYAILPTALLGLIFYKKIKSFNIYCTLYSLVLGGIFLIFSEFFKPKNCKTINITEITKYQSMMIGLSQIFSLYPGFSRSGSTISTGMLLGIKKSTAIQFSFIISIPLLTGASLFEIFNNINDIEFSNIMILFLGFFASFISSTFFINNLLNIINQTSFIFFGIYRCILALYIYFLI